MNHNIIIFCLVVIVSIILFLIFDKVVNFNPFKNSIKVSETFVSNVLGKDIELNKNTNKQNPLEIVKKKNHQKIPNEPIKNLVFTSAGDKTNFHNLWIGDNQQYDVMVVYYGKNDSTYKNYSKKADYILKRKGSKFQNFHYIYENYPEIINKYDRFFILDDDIIFNVEDINKMFELSKKYNFKICGPTFKNTPECKISHRVTKTENKNQFRYTNFIEVNVPLFNREALDKLMKYYDPVLIGWGIDYLFIWANGLNSKDSFALVDSVTCINPQDSKKGGKRELHNLPEADKRAAVFSKFAKKLGIPQIIHGKTLKTVKL